jgi:hypothetical protein
MKKTLFALLLTFSVSIGYGQVTLQDLKFIAKNNPSADSIKWTFNNAPDNNSTPDYWKLLNGSSMTMNVNMNTINYNPLLIILSVGTFAYPSPTISNVSDIRVELSNDNGMSWTTIRNKTFSAGLSSPSPDTIILSNGLKSLTSRLKITAPNATSSSGARIFSVQVTGTQVSSLPVELSIFRGEEQYLLWTTQSETQNKGWEVERSIDGKAWTNIGFVEGFGNSYQKLDYHFELKQFGKFYYRIKQIDYDGHFEYSPIEFLDNLNLFQEGKMYIDLSGRETTKPKANTMYIIPDGRKIMYIEK